MDKVIQFKVGSKMTGSAEPIYNELEKIRKRDGRISPVAVVQRAKAKSNVLHRFFEWDDSIAGEKYRLGQARKVTQSIEVRYIREDKPDTPPTRVYFSTREHDPVEDKEKRHVYHSVEEGLQDPIFRDEILGNAIRDALAFRRKYAALQELAKVFTVMDEFIQSAK